MTRVLVVEDEESYSDALSYVLRKEGFEVAVAETGPDALDEYDRAGADIVDSATKWTHEVRHRSDDGGWPGRPRWTYTAPIRRKTMQTRVGLAGLGHAQGQLQAAGRT